MGSSAVRATLIAVLAPALLYFGLLGAMIAAPSLQAHTIYLHKFTLGWSKDLNVPEQFGFAHRQVTPFYIPTSDGETLHCWHVLPLGAYHANQEALAAPSPEAGGVERFEDTLNFRLLKNNPKARLVLYFHGTGGNMATGWRPDSYRSLYAADPVNTHVLTFDYRGFGLSTGHPSEPGLIVDAVAVVDWALHTARIPPERIVIFGQSLGSAVAIAIAHELSRGEPAIQFAGLVASASFSDLAELTATYRIGGFFPVLSPIARVKPLFDYFTEKLHSTWDNMHRLGEFVSLAGKYDITILHAEDDADIPVEHSIRLFGKAVRSAENGKGNVEDVNETALLGRLGEARTSHGEGGSLTIWPTKKGEIRLQILKYGVHDKIVTYPATSLAVARAFDSA
ncbi:hypothetical protein ACJ41O_009312 [Fusarium nematophilum]